jgi:hypothetical protein
MRLPYALQGAIFAPVLVGLIFALKASCPESAGDACFADYFATPIFMPLLVIYKIFGGTSAAIGQEILLIFLYWGVVGFLIGFLIDLAIRRDQHTPQSPYSPGQHLPPSRTSAPGSPPPSQELPT